MDTPIRDKMNAILTALSSRGFSELELKRLLHDLESSYERLTKGEYLKSDFSYNRFHVPERTKEFYIYLEFYCAVAKTWAKVLGAMAVQNVERVVDLCPGWTPKIELALYYLGFKGEVVLIDYEQESTLEVVKFMELFRPAYSLEPLSLDIFSAHDFSAGLVLANHVIDDLLLGRLQNRYGYNINEVYKTEAQVRETWRRIMHDGGENADAMMPLLAAAFSRIVSPGGFLVLTHYAAYMERLLDLYPAVEYVQGILLRVVEQLCQRGFTARDDLREKAFEGFEGQFKKDEFFVLEHGMK